MMSCDCHNNPANREYLNPDYLNGFSGHETFICQIPTGQYLKGARICLMVDYKEIKNFNGFLTENFLKLIETQPYDSFFIATVEFYIDNNYMREVSLK